MTDLAGTPTAARPTGDASWRRRLQHLRAGLIGDSHPGWAIASLSIGLAVMLPVGAVVVLALTSRGSGLWALLGTALPPALYDTGLLLAGVAVVTGTVGMLTAWLVTMYRFWGSTLVDRLLVLPLAVPVYIVAYAYVDLLDYSGPVQSALRILFGWRSPRDYWFPDIRTISGAVLVFSVALYPYVYMIARASFVQQSSCALEVARTLGRTPWGVFFAIALPLARPAVAAGVALAMMECLNDLGAVQHLGLRTLSAAIFTTWLQRSDLGGAVQLALALLAITGLLMALERSSRGLGKRYAMGGRHRPIPFEELTGWRARLALGVCAVPVALGFGVPILILLRHAVLAGADGFGAGFFIAARNSAMLASLTALVAVACALVLCFARRVAASPVTRGMGVVSGLGYALPGTVVAIGLMFPLAGLDRALAAVVKNITGVDTGLLLSGSLAIVVLACTVRFLAVALGSLEDGLDRISPNLDAAARTLGATPADAMSRIHVPILTPAIASAGLLVFVDTMKELPATVLLRPFNFETLATVVYNRAALEQFEASALACLTIVAVGLVPVLLLHRAVATNRLEAPPPNLRQRTSPLET